MTTPPMNHAQTRRRRGTVYVMVLVTAMLTMVIGLSGLLVMRVERRSANLTNNAGQARNLAIAAVDRGLYEIAADNNWRTNHTHDVWTNPLPLGEGTVQFKFVDQTDGVLSDSDSDPVNVIGRGEIGQSIIMFSATLIQDRIVSGSWRQVVE